MPAVRTTMSKRKRTKGQALVEFALSATLIFFLLAAVVDLSLIFFRLQSLTNAAQEGAVYGSRWLTSTGQLDLAQIRDRARHESGDWSAARAGNFVNLLDLDNNNEEDNQAVIDSYIKAEAFVDPSNDGNPYRNESGNTVQYQGSTIPDGGTEHFPCPNPGQTRSDGLRCYVQVRVASLHHIVFPL